MYAGLPDEIRNNLVNLVREVNLVAHQTKIETERRALYRLKDFLLSGALTTMRPENVDMSFQEDEGRISLLVALHADQPRTFHAIFDRLLPSAKTRVWNEIGSPNSMKE